MLAILSIGGLLLMILGLVAMLARHALFSPEPWVWTAQGGAVTLMIWARVTFGARSFHASADPTAGGLVTSGPYRYIRHPIYTAVTLFGWAGVASHLSLANAALGGAILTGALVRLLCEERLVAARYPEYRQYAHSTWRMVPFLF